MRNCRLLPSSQKDRKLINGKNTMYNYQNIGFKHPHHETNLSLTVLFLSGTSVVVPQCHMLFRLCLWSLLLQLSIMLPV